MPLSMRLAQAAAAEGAPVVRKGRKVSSERRVQLCPPHRVDQLGAIPHRSQRMRRVAWKLRPKASIPWLWGALFCASSVAACVNRESVNDAGAASSSASPAASPAQSAPVTFVNATRRSESDCRACNGVWKTHGLSRNPSCNCRTRDAGTRCSDGAECQGQCVAEERAEQVIVDPGPPARGHFVGRCSDVMTVFGCHRFIARGAMGAGAVDLSVPPPKICFD